MYTPAAAFSGLYPLSYIIHSSHPIVPWLNVLSCITLNSNNTTAHVKKIILILNNQITNLSWNLKSALIWLHSTYNGLPLVTTSHTSHAFPFPSDTPWSFSFPLSFIVTTPPTRTQLSPLFPDSLRKRDVLSHWHLMQMCKSYENACHISHVQILSILAVPVGLLNQPTAYFLHIFLPGILAYLSIHPCISWRTVIGRAGCYCQHHTE